MDKNLFKQTLQVNENNYTYYNIKKLQDEGIGNIERLPFLLEF